jgi:CheY-like chemotaxis protein/HPt (histidine-containing phosphotransfer) domain-containing protein
MTAELDRLWTKYYPVNEARLAAVEAAAQLLSRGEGSGPEIEEGLRAAHKLAGSLGMFGHTGASTLAREAEEILASPKPDTARIYEILASIRSEVVVAQSAGEAPASPPAATDDSDPVERSPEGGRRQTADRRDGPRRHDPPDLLLRAAVAEVDVAIIDDDEVIAGLLVYALNKQGFTTEWISDGGVALRTLCGDQRTLTAKTIVLDVDLPGMDGMTLLRRMNLDGVLRASHVIMLTARSAESEVVKALQLGASDHIAKPFSLRVFLEKIRRTLKR